MENLRQVIETKNLTAEKRKSGLTVYPTEEILGSMVPVRDFAEFHAKHKVDLNLIRATLLMDYTEGDFTPETKRAFQMGLDAFLNFFENAEIDVDTYILNAQKKNS